MVSEHILQICETFAGLDPDRATELQHALNKHVSNLLAPKGERSGNRFCRQKISLALRHTPLSEVVWILHCLIHHTELPDGAGLVSESCAETARP
jgi:hypothetical protein